MKIQYWIMLLPLALPVGCRQHSPNSQPWSETPTNWPATPDEVTVPESLPIDSIREENWERTKAAEAELHDQINQEAERLRQTNQNQIDLNSPRPAPASP